MFNKLFVPLWQKSILVYFYNTIWYTFLLLTT